MGTHIVVAGRWRLVPAPHTFARSLAGKLDATPPLFDTTLTSATFCSLKRYLYPPSPNGPPVLSKLP